jgi:hypothetical protein
MPHCCQTVAREDYEFTGQHTLEMVLSQMPRFTPILIG